MKAIAYIRVSTQGQVDDGVSLAAQAAKIQAWAECNGYEMGQVFIDAGVSGTKANREGLQDALAAVGKGDALVVYSLSRLARNTAHTLEIAAELEKTGADLVSLSEKIDTSSAAGKMVFRLLAVLAEFERDQISERTKLAMNYKKSQNQRVGSIPYGKQLAADGVSLEDNADELAAVEIIKTLRRQGLTFAKIAAELDGLGYKPRGKKWHAKTLMTIAAA
jgi:DNA invertase Pin-like site-specific DNA recombinase